MAAHHIFTTEQLEFIQRSYLNRRLPPREVSKALNDKFGTSFTTRQVSSLIAGRGWAARKKIARAKAVETASTSVLVAAEHRAELATIKDVVAGHLRVGEVITERAAKFASTAETAKTLSSAASAARAGIAIVRQSLGLDSAVGAVVVTNGFFPGFSRSADSPFHRQPPGTVDVETMKRAGALPAEGETVAELT